MTGPSGGRQVGITTNRNVTLLIRRRTVGFSSRTLRDKDDYNVKCTFKIASISEE